MCHEYTFVYALVVISIWNVIDWLTDWPLGITYNIFTDRNNTQAVQNYKHGYGN